MSDFAIQHKRFPGAHLTNKTTGRNSVGFSDIVEQAVKRVNNMEIKADQSVEQLMKGKVGIHETMIALQKADISLRLLLQVRNKAMDAYREIMRMQF